MGYCRVSRQEQAEGHSLEQQAARLIKAGCIQVIQEVASGRKDERPEFKALINACRRGEVGCVVATRLDRISRSLKTAISFIELLDSLGVELKLLDDHFNFNTAGGKLQAGMLSLLSQFESDRLEERIKHGWQHLRDTARAINPPFGYVVENDKFKLDHRPFLSLIENKQELSRAEIAQDILNTFFKVHSLQGTLKVINSKYGIQRFKSSRRGQRGLFQFSPSGLSNWLNSPVLAGHTCYLRVKGGKRQPKDQWEITYNTHPDQTLLTSEQVAAIGAILAKNNKERKAPFPSRKCALSGLVYCANCRGGAYLQMGTRGKTEGYNYYYQCSNATQKACSNKKCVRIEKIEDAVVKALVHHKESNDPLLEVKHTLRRKNLEQKWSSLRDELSILVKLKSDNSAIHKAIEQLTAQINEIEAIFAVEDNETLELEQFLTLVDELKINPNTNNPFLFDISCKDVLHKLVGSVFIEDGTVKLVKLKLKRELVLD